MLERRMGADGAERGPFEDRGEGMQRRYQIERNEVRWGKEGQESGGRRTSKRYVQQIAPIFSLKASARSWAERKDYKMEGRWREEGEEDTRELRKGGEVQ